jgi:hypothetical protein
MWLHDTPAGTTAISVDTPWYQQIVPLIGQGLQVWNQQQVMDWAMKSAQAGTPVNQSMLQTLLNQTTPGVNVGLSSSTQNLLMYALLGAGGLAMLMMLTRKSKA